VKATVGRDAEGELLARESVASAEEAAWLENLRQGTTAADAELAEAVPRMSMHEDARRRRELGTAGKSAIDHLAGTQ
jgi:hypothetical protein